MPRSTDAAGRPLPGSRRRLGVKTVTIISREGRGNEARREVEAHIQPESGFFAVTTPITEGDVVEFGLPNGETVRRVVAEVKVYDVGSPAMQHTEVKWGRADPPA